MLHRRSIAVLLVGLSGLGVACKGSPQASTTPSTTVPTASVSAVPPVVATATRQAAAAEQDPLVRRRHSGWIYAPSDLQRDSEPAMEPRVISDKKGYEALVAMIPKRRIQMKQPAPPNDDPLLASPAIDFSRETLVVAFRADSMYVHPKLEVRRDQQLGKVVVAVSHPPLGDSQMAAAQSGVGTYAAAVVAAAAADIVVK